MAEIFLFTVLNQKWLIPSKHPREVPTFASSSVQSYRKKTLLYKSADRNSTRGDYTWQDK
jgi:hypothetical protein